jgi:hypothetical protein
MKTQIVLKSFEELSFPVTPVEAKAVPAADQDRRATPRTLFQKPQLLPSGITRAEPVRLNRSMLPFLLKYRSPALGTQNDL